MITDAAAQDLGSVAEREARGRAAQSRTPVSSFGEWEPPADRADPVELLMVQNRTREHDLVPVRHGRMMVTPFTFYRGAAKVMAADLADSPTAGLDVQLCGDAHLSNFGAYASPERQLLFGLNDFDETLPGPFEFDLLRMAASFTIAARNNGFTAADVLDVTKESVQSYRRAMAEFAAMRTLDVWYAHMSEQDILEAMHAVQQQVAGGPASAGDSNKKLAGASTKKKPKSGTKPRRDGDGDDRRRAEAADVSKSIKLANKNLRKAHSRDSLHALGRFAEVVDGRYRIASQPPVVVPLRDLEGAWGRSSAQIRELVEDQFRAYQDSLSADRRQLLQRFTIVDMARKVVGVGSVGTRAFMVLLQGRDTGDPLFLQVKEATRSVLEDQLPRSRFATPGERVVQGQRMMQAASDIFLGWTTGVEDDRFYYWRQLRDMKGSAVVEAMTPFSMTFYAQLCGWTLARAHARSGDPVAIAAYLGDGDDIDRAVTAFSARYADQNERDHATFVKAAADGRIDAVEGI